MHDQPHIPRHVAGRVSLALDDTRIVALVGPRQSGKTTLARRIAAQRGLHFITLDDAQFRHFANDDPDGLVADLDCAVIDEIQRAPELMLALKKSVDENPRPGRFLLTGSVDLFRGARSADSLAGRVETIELLPFSQAEMAGRDTSDFLDRLFTANFPQLHATGRTPDLIERVLAGGYPEANQRGSTERQQAWLRTYARTLGLHDALDLAQIARPDALVRLLDHAAITSGELVNLSALATALGVSSKSVDRWLTLLEHMFVLRRVPAWHRNDLKRLVRKAKLHFLDSGLLAALRRVNANSVRADRARLGNLLEGFVFSELTKLATLLDDDLRISHYRDKDKVEVDFVLEVAGQVAGVEVKSAVSVKPDDFRGLRALQHNLGNAFACGVLLHDGERIQRVAERLFAMPVGQLWA